MAVSVGEPNYCGAHQTGMLTCLLSQSDRCATEVLFQFLGDCVRSIPSNDPAR